MDPFFRRAICQ